jgi:hypothetical protein
MKLRGVLVFVFAALAIAGSAYGDSIFDTGGLGRDIIPATGATRALGGAVVAARDPLSVSIISPFGSAVTDRITITGGFSHTTTRSEALGENKRMITTLFPSVGLTVPIRGLSFLTGLYVEKAGRLSLAETDTIYEIEIYDAEFRRESSVYSVPVLVSKQLHPRVVASAGLVLSFFDTRETTAIDFRDENRYDTDDVYDMHAMGESFVAGLLLDYSRVRIGGIFRTEVELDGTLEGENRFSGIYSSEDVKLTAPTAFYLGIRVAPIEQVVVEADYHQSPWSETKLDGRRLTSQDAERWAVGIEYRGRRPWNASRYPLLAGYYRQPLDSEGPFGWGVDFTGKITEQVFSVGTSIPVAGDRGAVTLAFEFGQRKVEGETEVGETIYGFSLSVAAMEAWRGAIRR